jgi:hypothetical protein
MRKGGSTRTGLEPDAYARECLARQQSRRSRAAKTNHRLYHGTGGKGFVFPNKTRTGPFNPGTLTLHTTKAWNTNGLTPIGLHDAATATPPT